MAQFSESDRNTDSFDAPSDGPDGYREASEIDDVPALCIFCGQHPAAEYSDYCSTSCAILAEAE